MECTWDYAPRPANGELDRKQVGEAMGSSNPKHVTSTWTLDAGRAQLAAWSLLALINQVLIAVRLP